MKFCRLGLSPSISGRRDIPCRRPAAVLRRSRQVRDGWLYDRLQSSIGRSVGRQTATIIASSSAFGTVELGCVAPVLRSSIVTRLRHFASASTLTPRSRLSAAVVACDDCITALIACLAVTYLSHNASFNFKKQGAPSNRGIKQLSKSCD